MFNKTIISALTFAASAQADSVAEGLLGMQCNSIASTSLTFWDISAIGDVEYNQDGYKWTYCEKNSEGVYASQASGSVWSTIADQAITTGENIKDEDSETIGVKITQGSERVCVAAATEADDAINYSFVTKLYCDEDITGAPTIESVAQDTTDACVVTATLKHAAGCPTINADLDQYVDWLSDNQWCIGIIYLVAGPLIALFGTAWFPYVAASLVAIFIIGIVTSFSLAMGWMASTGGTIGVLCAAIVLGVLAGCLIRRKIWIMVGLLGLVAGFFSGTLVYALIYGMSGWDAVWGFWLIASICGVAGLVAACFLGKSVVLLSTSMVGSYLFMRSWTLFFPGHYPSEAELIDGSTTLEPDAAFWGFISIFIVAFIISGVFQCKQDQSNEELDDEYKN